MSAPTPWQLLFELRNQRSRARLRVAAYNSYARAFGSRAVEAAESDWIGRALKSLKRLSDCLAYEVHLPTDGGENRIAVNEARALLAETEQSS